MAVKPLFRWMWGPSNPKSIDAERIRQEYENKLGRKVDMDLFPKGFSPIYWCDYREGDTKPYAHAHIVETRLSRSA